MVITGADPEVFVLNPQGKCVGAHNFYPPQKEAVQVMEKSPNNPYITQGGRFFRDGWALEVNPRPSACRALVYEDVRGLLSKAKKSLPEGYTFSTQPTVHLEKDALEGAPEDCLLAGCSPSWDAYSGEMKLPELDYMEYTKRHSGGHLHFSTHPGSKPNPFLTEEDVRVFIKLCDLYIGLPSTVLFPSDGLWERREVYGQAGEFRIQKYPNGYNGAEYRTPSAEIFNHPMLHGLFSGIAAYFIVPNFTILKEKWNAKLEPVLQKAINTGVGAVELLSELGDVPNFINGHTVMSLSGRPEIRELHALKDHVALPESHKAWGEYSKEWGLPVPEWKLVL